MNWPEIAAAATTLFFVMDPLGNIPIFNAVLTRFTPRQRLLIMVRELFIALGLLLGFLYAGNAMLSFMGLSQSSLSISGGVLLFIIAIRMVFPKPANEEEEVDDPFIVPLAMPLVAGPSTIALLLLMSSREPERITEWTVALTAAWAATTILLISPPLLMRLLGSRGLRAMERLMGMLLVMMATQMLLNGIAAFYFTLN